MSDDMQAVLERRERLKAVLGYAKDMRKGINSFIKETQRGIDEASAEITRLSLKPKGRKKR